MQDMVDRHLLGGLGGREMGVTPRRHAHSVQFGQLGTIAQRQHGLVDREQALGAVRRGALEHALRSGHLERVRRGVYRFAGTPETWEQQVLAACLAGGPTTVASFRTAAALWDLEGFPRLELEATVSRARRARLPGVVVHQSEVWGSAHVARRSGIPVTSIARTLCDLTAVTRPWIVERAVDQALRRRLVTVRRLAATYEALAGRGRRRSTIMRKILEHRLPGYEPGESAPEQRIADLLVRSGLPRPVQQHRVRIGNRSARIDLAYPERCIAIEYDGWDFHGNRSAFDEDRARGNDLVLLGFQLLRFTSRSSDQTIVDVVTAAYTRGPSVT
jgi:hypothetical protein